MYTVSLVTPRELNPDCVINVFSTVCILPGHCDISHCFRDVGCNSQACTYTSSGIVPVAHNATYHTVRNPKSLITVLTQNLIVVLFPVSLALIWWKFICILYFHVTETSHLHSLRDFWRHLVYIGLRHLVTVALLCHVQIFLLTYLLTYLLTPPTIVGREQRALCIWVVRPLFCGLVC